jgi:hypothetical protein
MNKVFGSYNGPYPWAFRITGAAAGASVTCLALRALNVSPGSPAGLALQAGAALAGSRFYPLAVSEGIQYALDKMPSEWAWRANQAFSAAIVFTAMMLTPWSWQAVAIKLVCATTVLTLHFKLIDQIYRDRLPSFTPEQIRAFVRYAPAPQLIEIAKNLPVEYLKTPAALAFLDAFGSRNDIDSAHVRTFFLRFSNQTIRRFDPNELSNDTINRLTFKKFEPEKVLHLLHCLRADQQIKILRIDDFLIAGYVANNASISDQYPTLADETIDYIMQNNPSVCDVAYCARQRKDLAPKLAEFTSLQLLGVVGDGYDELYEHSLMKVVVESLPDDKLLELLNTLQNVRSRWLALALRHVLSYRKIKPDDATLIRWANLDYGAACVVIAARPDLYAKCDPAPRETINAYIEPKTVVSVMNQTENDPFQWCSTHTMLKACTLVEQTAQSDKVKAWAQKRLSSMIKGNALHFFLSADLSVLKSLNMESLEESHRCYAFARGVTAAIDPQDARISGFRALYDIWHATDTHFFGLDYFRIYFGQTRESVQDQETPERLQEVLFWLAHFVQKKDGFEKIPKIIAGALKAYPKMYGCILGLWEQGKEEGKVRLEFLLKNWSGSYNKDTFTESYHCSRIKTYEKFIRHRFKVFPNNSTAGAFTALDQAISRLASLLAYEDVPTHQTAVWRAPAPFTNMPSGVFFKICHLLPAVSRWRLGKVNKGLSDIIFTSHHQQVWRDLGSLRAFKNMYALFKEIKPNNPPLGIGIIYSLYKEIRRDNLSEEAFILQQAILCNLPHLRGK